MVGPTFARILQPGKMKDSVDSCGLYPTLVRRPSKDVLLLQILPPSTHYDPTMDYQRRFLYENVTLTWYKNQSSLINGVRCTNIFMINDESFISETWSRHDPRKYGR